MVRSINELYQVCSFLNWVDIVCCCCLWKCTHKRLLQYKLYAVLLNTVKSHRTSAWLTVHDLTIIIIIIVIKKHLVYRHCMIILQKTQVEAEKCYNKGWQWLPASVFSCINYEVWSIAHTSSNDCLGNCSRQHQSLTMVYIISCWSTCQNFIWLLTSANVVDTRYQCEMKP